MTDECAVEMAGDAEVIDLVGTARRRLIVAAPAVSQAVARAICECARGLAGDPATVILDTDPEVYRLGYGELGSLSLFEAAANEGCIVLRRQPGLRISIVIADERTLIFSPTPQLIEAGPNTAGGANAIYFGWVPPTLEQDLGPAKGRPRVGGEPLSSADSERIRRDLQDNPPQKFDIARCMRVFNAYYEFCELELTGVHVERRRVSIPAHLLGVADEQTQARLQGHFQVVPVDSQISGRHLRERRDWIAWRYLRPIPKFGTVVRRTDKPALEQAVTELRVQIENFKQTVMQDLQDWIDRGRDQLITALLPGLLRNPPREWCAENGRLDEETCRGFLERDLARSLGTANRLVSGMEVTVRFKGLTYETLNDKSFLEAAKKAGVDIARLHAEFDAAKATAHVPEP